MNSEAKYETFVVVATSDELKTIIPTEQLGGLWFKDMEEMREKVKEVLGRFKENAWDIYPVDRYDELDRAGHKWGHEYSVATYMYIGEEPVIGEAA